MTVLAVLPALGQVKQLAERQSREMYWRSLCALARRAKVPNVALSHLAVRVLLFLLGQRPGYFAHHKVIAQAVESNLTSVRKALFELRAAGFVSWDLIPPQHPLPTGKYTRTNVNQYFVEADALLRALDGGEAGGSPRTVASTHPNSSASTGTDPKFEQDPPLPPSRRSEPAPDRCSGKGEIQFSKFHGARPALGQPHTAAGVHRADQGRSRTVPPELEKVLAAWRNLGLGEPDDRSTRALRNRLAEGATSEQLAAAVEGARHDEWLREGRAKSPFAVVFASLASVDRFANAGREHARKTEATARERAAERRAARARLDDVVALSPAESAELVARALRTVAYLAPPIRSNYSPIPITNFSTPLAISPAIMARPREIPCTKVTAEIQVGLTRSALMVFRVRQLARDEWSLLRDLRLAALTDAPDHFGETSLAASLRSAEEWAALTSSDTPGTTSGSHVAEIDGAPVGMVFSIQDRTDATTGRLGGMWVEPDARGHGIGMALARAVLDWSRAGGMQRVRLWVVPSTAAHGLYHRALFIPTGAQKPFPGDDSRSVIEMQVNLGDAT